MSWECKNCKHKLSGKEKFCPECAATAIYECKDCGKVMDDGKHKFCPICSTARTEKRNTTLKGVGSAVVAVGTVVVGLFTKGKIGGSGKV